MRLRVPDASVAPWEVYYGAQNVPDYRPRPAHLAGTGVYAPSDSLARKPCLSGRPKCLILQGHFAQFALLRMRCYWTIVGTTLLFGGALTDAGLPQRIHVSSPSLMRTTISNAGSQGELQRSSKNPHRPV
jgi:hypothetical protein